MKKRKKGNKKLLENIENGILSGKMIDMNEITRLLAEHEIKDVAKCILKYPKSRMRKTKAKKYILCNTCKQTLRNKKYLEIHQSENPRCLLEWERKNEGKECPNNDCTKTFKNYEKLKNAYNTTAMTTTNTNIS